MRFLPTTALFALAISLCIASRAQAQRTINDCEQIQAADAYNQCLAKFGPPAKTLNVEAQRPGDVKGGSEEAASGASPGKAAVSGRRHGRGRAGVYRRGRSHHVGRPSRSRHGGGRKRMSIPVGK